MPRAASSALRSRPINVPSTATHWVIKGAGEAGDVGRAASGHQRIVTPAPPSVLDCATSICQPTTRRRMEMLTEYIEALAGLHHS